MYNYVQPILNVSRSRETKIQGIKNERKVATNHGALFGNSHVVFSTTTMMEYATHIQQLHDSQGQDQSSQEFEVRRV